MLYTSILFSFCSFFQPWFIPFPLVDFLFSYISFSFPRVPFSSFSYSFFLSSFLYIRLLSFHYKFRFSSFLISFLLSLLLIPSSSSCFLLNSSLFLFFPHSCFLPASTPEFLLFLSCRFPFLYHSLFPSVFCLFNNFHFPLTLFSFLPHFLFLHSFNFT